MCQAILCNNRLFIECCHASSVNSLPRMQVTDTPAVQSIAFDPAKYYPVTGPNLSNPGTYSFYSPGTFMPKQMGKKTIFPA